MKPLGPIPAGFNALDGELVIGGKNASALVEQTGGVTPLFVYSRELIERRLRELRAALPAQVGTHYAVKANPYVPILELMSGLVDGFDIASAGELQRVREAGIDPAIVSFAGPGKRDDELEAAIAVGTTLNLESRNEALRALAIAERIGVTPRLAIRVNPTFELRGSGMKMGGGAKQFGIDEHLVAPLARELIAAGAEWRGLHIFAGSQALDAEALIETQANTLALAARLADEIGARLPALNMGGGFAVSSKGKADTTAGTLRVKVTVQGAGTLHVAPAAGSRIKGSRLEVGRADVVPVTLRPTASGLRQLRKTGELQVRARFTFTPCGGAGSSVVGRYTLRLR